MGPPVQKSSISGSVEDAHAASSDKRKQSDTENAGPSPKKVKLDSSGGQGQDTVASHSDDDFEEEDDPNCPVGAIWLSSGAPYQFLEDPSKWKEHSPRECVFWWADVVAKAKAVFDKESASVKEAREKAAREKSRDTDEDDDDDEGCGYGIDEFDNEIEEEEDRMLLDRCASDHTWLGYIDWDEDVLQDPRSRLFLDNLREVYESKCEYPRVVASKENPGPDVPCFKVIVGELSIDGNIFDFRRGGVRWLTDVKGWGEESHMEEFLESLSESVLWQ